MNGPVTWTLRKKKTTTTTKNKGKNKVLETQTTNDWAGKRIQFTFLDDKYSTSICISSIGPMQLSCCRHATDAPPTHLVRNIVKQWPKRRPTCWWDQILYLDPCFYGWAFSPWIDSRWRSFFSATETSGRHACSQGTGIRIWFESANEIEVRNTVGLGGRGFMKQRNLKDTRLQVSIIIYTVPV